MRRPAPPAIALVAAGAVSVQSGAAIATGLFGRVGPAGAVTLRTVLGAVVLLIVARPRVTGRSRADWGAVAAFGLVLAAMNVCFYEAIARIPLGVAVTLEFVGPLAVAVGGSRRALDIVWALLAAAGVVLLGSDPSGQLAVSGGVLALMAGGCWAGYILLNREVGRRAEGISGLALALVVASVALTPAGVAAAGGRLIGDHVLARGLVVAVLSTVVPYSLEVVALRRTSARAFGVLLSIDPALAALAGLVMLGQSLRTPEWVALGLVVAANLGSALEGRPHAAMAVPVEPG